MAISLGSPGTSPAPATNTTTQILLDTPPVFTYDAAGNMTSDGKNNYAWNDEDRLASVTPVFPRQGDLKLTYAYDYQGRRVYTDRYTFSALPGSGGTPAAGGSWAAASRTFYQYQGWNVVGSTLLNFGSGGFTTPAGSTAYAWGVDLSGSLQGAGGVGGLLAMRDGAGALAEYHYDFNGNVVGLADPASPQLLAEYTYDPFGKRLSASGPLAAANPFRFSTKIEEETGWNYYGYRFYAPEIGRWPSRDPIGERGGVNFYIFLNNRVATYVDILGREAYPGLGPIPPISGGVWNPIQDYVDGEVDDSDANPHEKEWARVHLCCGKVATKMNGKLKRAFVEAGYNNKGAPGVWNDGLEDLDGTSVNAVLHCALTCAMASSIWCSKEDVAGFGVAHETGNQQNSLKDMTMDLYNNAVGLELSENGQTISECIRKCEQAAHNDRLRWYNKLEPWALNPDGLAIDPNYNPDDYANFWPPTEDELNNQQSVLAP